MSYNNKNGCKDNWLIVEDDFDPYHLGKGEAILSLGNGYMGIRSSTEEKYASEVRNTFLAGTYNKFYKNEVTELPNIADVIQMEIKVNGEILDLKQGQVYGYSRTLNLQNGELTRTFEWENANKARYAFKFLRFVSMDNLHLIGQRIEIKALNCDTMIDITSGINGQMTNSGIQHFADGDKRLYDQRYLQLVQKTTESEIEVVINTVHTFKRDEEFFQPNALVVMDRRKIHNAYQMSVRMGETIIMEKLSSIHTSRDLDMPFESLENLKNNSLEHLKAIYPIGYEALLSKNAEAWLTKVWDAAPISIKSENAYDQLVIRFAQYHLAVMAPAHDSRMSVAAKGLSGEGYKGHIFWDTEIFILPYFIYTQPNIARSLLTYRYKTLSGAREKAKKEGYEGAMYPWESAWLDDGEVTPIWGAADIITGKPTKIWSGFIEQHITADVSYAIWQYYNVTGDQAFMDSYGYEIILDTGKFWASRLEWDETSQLYHINNVIGPDEYKEHVDDNAFTNHMAYWTINLAVAYTDQLKVEKPHIYAQLNERLELTRVYQEWIKKSPLIYLPKPNEKGIIPQDKTYLTKTVIDLEPYKTQKHVGSIFKSYNLSQVNEIQVSKQADVMILLYLLEDQFSNEVKRACWQYYEPKTLHDSSLSLSTHTVLAADMNQLDLAYELFTRATKIDLGSNRKSSCDGIHAASIGGIWQCVVNGFGGIRMNSGHLRIEPNLPEPWEELVFTIIWQGVKLEVLASRTGFEVSLVDAVKPITFTHKDKTYVCTGKTSILYAQ